MGNELDSGTLTMRFHWTFVVLCGCFFFFCVCVSLVWGHLMVMMIIMIISFGGFCPASKIYTRNSQLENLVDRMDTKHTLIPYDISIIQYKHVGGFSGKCFPSATRYRGRQVSKWAMRCTTTCSGPPPPTWAGGISSSGSQRQTAA